MQKVWYITFLSLLLLLCCACSYTEESPSMTSTVQTNIEKDTVNCMTIIRTNSPPVCKTSNDTATIHKVKNLIQSIEKTEYSGPPMAGWNLAIDFDDGSSFSMARNYIDIDGVQYTIEETTYTSLYDSLIGIYNSIHTKETKYTGTVNNYS